MKRLLLPAVLLLVLTATAAAQDTAPPTSVSETETPVNEEFQPITAGGIDFQVDPFYVVVAFPVERTERLEAEGEIRSTITYQLFVRDGAEMVDAGRYTTTDTGIAPHIGVGQAMIGVPQVEAQQAQP